jgi:hypothetical protein
MNLNSIKPRAPTGSVLDSVLREPAAPAVAGVGDAGDSGSLSRATSNPDLREIAAQPSTAHPPPMAMDKLLQERAKIEMHILPVLAAHELQLDALHGEALRLVHQHQQDRDAGTLDRLRECVEAISVRITIRF